MDKEHKDPETIDLEARLFARSMHVAQKKNIKTLCIGSPVRHDQTSPFFLQDTPSLLYPEIYCDENLIICEIG